MIQTRRHLLALAAISLLVYCAGCSDRNPTDLEPARATVDPLVFDDDYGHDVYFQPFFETHYTAASLDSVYAYGGFAPDGDRSLKFNIPPVGSALGPYTGGVLTSSGSRDLTDFNALTFYARTNNPVILDVAGFGNDNTGDSLYEAGRANISLTNEWTFIIVPIPDSSKLISERGLFTFAESPEIQYSEGYDVWVDEIRFARLGNITDPQPELTSPDRPVRKQYFVGATVSVSDTKTKFQVDGAEITVNHSPDYFQYHSDNPSVVDIVGSQIITVGAGTATITAKLDTVDGAGYIALTVHDPPPTAATPPGLPAGDVISMFSDVYNDVPVDSWRTEWSRSGPVQDYVVEGDNTKMYTFGDGEHYVGIEFVNPTVNASEMTHLHLDVYAPSGADFRVKLGSFPNGLGPADPHPESLELILNETTTPPFTSGDCVSLDIPLADFRIPTNWVDDWDWANIGHLILSTPLAGTSKTPLVLVDNIYWHK